MEGESKDVLNRLISLSAKVYSIKMETVPKAI